MRSTKKQVCLRLQKSNVFVFVSFSPCKTSCWWQSPVWCCCSAARNWSWFRLHRHPPHQNSYCWIFLHRQEGAGERRESKCQTFPSGKLIWPILQPHLFNSHVASGLKGSFVISWIFHCLMTLVSCVFASYHTPQLWQWCHCPSYNVIHSAAEKAAGQTRSFILLSTFNPKPHLKEIGNGKIYTTSASTTPFHPPPPRPGRWKTECFLRWCAV